MTTAEQSMIERVARAIMAARDSGGCIVKDWRREGEENPHVAQALRQARAAIEALHEPSPEMQQAVHEKRWDSQFGSDEVFSAAIDAILNEETGK